MRYPNFLKQGGSSVHTDFFIHRFNGVDQCRFRSLEQPYIQIIYRKPDDFLWSQPGKLRLKPIAEQVFSALGVLEAGERQCLIDNIGHIPDSDSERMSENETALRKCQLHSTPHCPQRLEPSPCFFKSQYLILLNELLKNDGKRLMFSKGFVMSSSASIMRTSAASRWARLAGMGPPPFQPSLLPHCPPTSLPLPFSDWRVGAKASRTCSIVRGFSKTASAPLSRHLFSRDGLAWAELTMIDTCWPVARSRYRMAASTDSPVMSGKPMSRRMQW